jgi:hypothetical protein
MEHSSPGADGAAEDGTYQDFPVLRRAATGAMNKGAGEKLLVIVCGKLAAKTNADETRAKAISSAMLRRVSA